MDWKKALAIFGPATLTVLIALINTGNWAYLLLLALTPLALWWAGFDFSQLLAEESYPYYDLGLNFRRSKIQTNACSEWAISSKIGQIRHRALLSKL